MSRKEPTVNDVIRVGRISAVFPERGTATVTFPDRGGLVSKEIPIGQPNTLLNKDYVLPDPGEHVVCAFFGNGLSEGVVLCSIYDAKNVPATNDPDKRTVLFPDGTRLEYDRKTHKLSGRVAGDVDIEVEGDAEIEAAGAVRIVAAQGVEITAGAGGATLSGNFSMTGNLKVTGNIQASGTITDESGNTNHHTH